MARYRKLICIVCTVNGLRLKQACQQEAYLANTQGEDSYNYVQHPHPPPFSSATPLLLTICLYLALELNLMNVVSVMLVQLPRIPYLTVLSLPQTPIDLKIF